MKLPFATPGCPNWTLGQIAANARAIRDGVDFLYRFACSATPWPYPQIEPVDWRMKHP